MTSVAVLMTSTSYEAGIADVIALFETQYPRSALQIVPYVVEPTPESVDAALSDYLARFPNGNRAVLSELTTLLLLIAAYLDRQGILNVLCVSVTATTNIIQTIPIPYALTYGPPLATQVRTQMLVIRDYGMTNVHILYQADSLNTEFITQYRESMIAQCALLNIPIREEVLGKGYNYTFTNNSAVLVLADTVALTGFFTPAVLATIPPSSYLTLTNLNFDVGDIFSSVPAFVFLVAPIDYTPTSQQVQQAVSSGLIFYGVYAAYDTLLTLNLLVTFGLPFSVRAYVGVNVDIPLAYANGSTFDLTTRAIPYGNYDVIFTKNVLFSSPKKLDIFLRSTSGGLGISSLRDSYSVFRTTGIVAFFSNGYYYVLQDLIYIQQGKNGPVIAIKFNKNITRLLLPGGSTSSLEVNVGENIPTRFYDTVDPATGYFCTLERINECNVCPPVVNPTMSKKTSRFYIS